MNDDRSQTWLRIFDVCHEQARRGARSEPPHWGERAVWRATVIVPARLLPPALCAWMGECGGVGSAAPVLDLAVAGAAPAHRQDSQRADSHRSSGRRPVRRAIRASMRGPISSPSWNAKTTSGQPFALQHSVRSALTLHAPADAQERTQDDRGARRGQSGTRSSGGSNELDRVDGARVLAVLDPVRDDPEREGLHGGDRLGGVDAVGHHARQLKNLGQPSAVGLEVDLAGQPHASSVVRWHVVATTLPERADKRRNRLNTSAVSFGTIPPTCDGNLATSHGAAQLQSLSLALD